MLPRQYYDAAAPFPYEWCNTGDYTNYQDVITPYIKNSQIFKCPSSQLSAKAATAYNTWLHGRSLGSIQYPSSTLMVLDSNWEWMQTDMTAEQPAGRVFSRHNDGFNVVYGDGHAKWGKRSQMTMNQLNEALAATPWP